MNKIEEAIIGHWGERCPDYTPGCPCCEAWAEYDAMRGDLWQPIETAPLNPYGTPWGPPILVWDSATESPVSAYFEPWYGWKDRDSGPAWVLNDGVGDDAIDPEDATHWMPFLKPSK